MIGAAAVLLSLVALTPEAQAGRDRPTYKGERLCRIPLHICHLRVTGPAAGVGVVTAQVASVRGDEDLTLAWTGSRLHGAVPIGKLPAKDTKAALTLYDKGGRQVVTYSGVVWSDGTVTLKPSGSSGVRLLSAHIVTTAKGVDLVVDVEGKSVGDVTYGSFTVEGVVKEASVVWDAPEGVWEAELLAEGPVDVDLRVESDGGGVLANTKTSIGSPWDDGGEGVGNIPTDDDPLTTVGLLRGKEGARLRHLRQLTVVSQGWDLDEAPTSAQVDLGDRTSVTIPANSYLRRMHAQETIAAEYDAPIREASLRLDVDGRRLFVNGAEPTLADLARPLCAEGICAMLTEGPDGYALSITQYRWDTAFPVDSVAVELSAFDAGGKVLFTHKTVGEFDDEVTAVFAQDVTLDGDPVGGTLGGKVHLVSPDGNTLANGRFAAALTVDDAGDLDLGGVGVDDVAALEPSFGVLLGAQPSPCGDDDGWLAPPLLALQGNNGEGTEAERVTVPTQSEASVLFKIVDTR